METLGRELRFLASESLRWVCSCGSFIMGHDGQEERLLASFVSACHAESERERKRVCFVFVFVMGHDGQL